MDLDLKLAMLQAEKKGYIQGRKDEQVIWEQPHTHTRTHTLMLPHTHTNATHTEYTEDCETLS